ncbi:MAG TPA: LapA family protein [Longimicrobiaceae bacterium]|nr:LapA family protein [Longimicrobiaceae bacterium]
MRGGWLAVAALALLAAGFAYLNRGERTVLHLGFTTLFQAPVALVVLGAFLLGMVAMFLLGLRHDLKVRRALRERTVAADRDDTEVFGSGYHHPSGIR